MIRPRARNAASVLAPATARRFPSPFCPRVGAGDAAPGHLTRHHTVPATAGTAPGGTIPPGGTRTPPLPRTPAIAGVNSAADRQHHSRRPHRAGILDQGRPRAAGCRAADRRYHSDRPVSRRRRTCRCIHYTRPSIAGRSFGRRADQAGGLNCRLLAMVRKWTTWRNRWVFGAFGSMWMTWARGKGMGRGQVVGAFGEL